MMMMVNRMRIKKKKKAEVNKKIGTGHDDDDE